VKGWIMLFTTALAVCFCAAVVAQESSESPESTAGVVTIDESATVTTVEESAESPQGTATVDTSGAVKTKEPGESLEPTPQGPAESATEGGTESPSTTANVPTPEEQQSE
jgi:hypothetical protein